MSITEQLKNILNERIMVLDGAMGSLIQGYKLQEEDFRKGYFEDHNCPLQGNNDLLAMTRPDVIQEIHEAYYEAGADFATTNSFSGTTIAQADYELEHIAYELNKAAAECAKKAADVWTAKQPEKPRFVVGGMGPTNRTCSISPDVNDPGKRLVTFDELKIAYRQQAEGLIDGGSDILMIETVFDTLNCKAAIYAVNELKEERNIDIPVMVSGTITDASGRTLTGQTVEAFWASIMHGELFSVGLNCALGADEMYPYIRDLAKVATCMVSAHPNAGLPNEFGEYDESAEIMGPKVGRFMSDGLLNIVGGCCGTTPAHISELAKLASSSQPHACEYLENLHE